MGLYITPRYGNAVLMKTIHTKEYKLLTNWLVTKRQLAGLSQSELARCLSKPQSYVSKYENAERRLDFMEVLSICKAINADPFELIKIFI